MSVTPSISSHHSAVENECTDQGGDPVEEHSAYYNKRAARENTDKCQRCFESKPTDSEFGAFSLELNSNQSFYFTTTTKKAPATCRGGTYQSHIVQTLSRECFDAVDHIVLMRTRLHHGVIV